jgi:hypothetical protein
MAENEQQGQQSGENNQNGQGEATFTQEQLDQAIETRLSRERETFEKNKAQMRTDLTAEIKKQLEAEQAESKTLEEMNETERANYERDQAIKAKEDLERKLNRSNTEKTVTEMLSEEGIPASKELLGMIVQDDVSAEDTKKTVNAFVKLFNDTVDNKVQEEVKTKLAGRTVFGTNGGGDGAQTIGAKFAEMANKRNTAPANDLWK